MKENNRLKSERIAALKEQNMELYMKLVSTEKNSRLMQILEQTHKYLQNIGSKVFLQKNENNLLDKKTEEDPEKAVQGDFDAFGNKITNNEENQDEEGDGMPQQTDDERIRNNMRNSSKIYYQITHSVTEDIK